MCETCVAQVTSSVTIGLIMWVKNSDCDPGNLGCYKTILGRIKPDGPDQSDFPSTTKVTSGGPEIRTSHIFCATFVLVSLTNFCRKYTLIPFLNHLLHSITLLPYLTWHWLYLTSCYNMVVYHLIRAGSPHGFILNVFCESIRTTRLFCCI